MKALLATADLHLLDRAIHVLRRRGCRVLWAVDGAEALRRWEESTPSLVLLDADLGQVDALQVCREMRGRSDAATVLFADSLTPDLVARALEVGVDGYLPKPFSMRQLEVVLRFWTSFLGGEVLRERGAATTEVAVAAVRVDARTASVEVNGQAIQLAPWLVRAVYLLALDPGAVISDGCLMDVARAWGERPPSHLAFQRRMRALGQRIAPGAARLVRVPGSGYALTER